MTSAVDVINRALQNIGTRTTITAAELTAQSSNEAIQAQLVYESLRDELLRMAPWDCALNTANLVYITSVPGTSENTSPVTQFWQKGQPSPPWAYEYQYPVDCLKACWLMPTAQTGQAGVPITTAVTGSAPNFWAGAPIRFKVAIDQFIPVTAAAVAAGGTGHAVGDVITLAETVAGDPPIGAPVKLLVVTAPAGVIGTVSVVNQIIGSASPQGGSYFAQQTNPVAQSSSTGSGVGATFNLTYGAQSSQRVILTNQQYATMSYVKQITDPNLMDPLFIRAWIDLLGARLTMALTGDKGLAKDLANQLVSKVNGSIMEARKADGNEGLTVNDTIPDWIRIRGFNISGYYSGPYQPGFDWGSMWPLY